MTMMQYSVVEETPAQLVTLEAPRVTLGTVKLVENDEEYFSTESPWDADRRRLAPPPRHPHMHRKLDEA